ncbi:MAG TPA: hypothetical protein VGB37_05200 [Candidatus Lokiarchaeia archaeon]
MLTTGEEKSSLEKRIAWINGRLNQLGSWLVSSCVKYDLTPSFVEMCEKSDLPFHKKALENNREYHVLAKELKEIESILSEK